MHLKYRHKISEANLIELQGKFDTQLLATSTLLFYFNFIYLFIYGCIGSSLLRAGPLQLQRVGATPHCSMRASHCSGLSRCGAQVPGTRASAAVARGLSSCGSRALEHSLSSCSARA